MPFLSLLSLIQLEGRWQEGHKIYGDESLEWSQNRLRISHEDVYQGVNSRVDNAINNQVNKMITSKAIRQFPPAPDPRVVCSGFMY